MLKNILFVLFIIPNVFAFSLVNIESGETINRALVKFDDGSNQNYLISDEGNISFPLLDQKTLFLVRANSSDTYDYFSLLDAGSVPDVVYVRAGGKLQGTVIDEKDNLIAHAPVRVVCATIEEDLFTDSTGYYQLFLPTETCNIIVASNGRVGSGSAVIEKGKISEVAIVLNQQVKKESVEWGWLVLLGIIFFVTLSFIILRQKKPVHKTADAKIIPSTVTAVLKPKEKMIVEQLEMHSGKAKLAKLRLAVGLPRTSLLRTLESLESRGIVVKRSEKGQVIVELIKKASG